MKPLKRREAARAKLALEYLEQRRVMTIYVEHIGGSDNNAGTSENSAIRTLAPIISYYDNSQAPSHRIALTPREHVILKPGDYTNTYRYASDTQQLQLSSDCAALARDRNKQ